MIAWPRLPDGIVAALQRQAIGETYALAAHGGVIITGWSRHGEINARVPYGRLVTDPVSYTGFVIADDASRDAIYDQTIDAAETVQPRYVAADLGIDEARGAHMFEVSCAGRVSHEIGFDRTLLRATQVRRVWGSGRHGHHGALTWLRPAIDPLPADSLPSDLIKALTHSMRMAAEDALACGAASRMLEIMTRQTLA